MKREMWLLILLFGLILLFVVSARGCIRLDEIDITNFEIGTSQLVKAEEITVSKEGCQLSDDSHTISNELEGELCEFTIGTAEKRLFPTTRTLSMRLSGKLSDEVTVEIIMEDGTLVIPNVLGNETVTATIDIYEAGGTITVPPCSPTCTITLTLDQP